MRLKHKAVILVYHSFVNPSNPRLDYSPDGMTVSAKVFAKHIKYLSKHYRVISLNELIDILNNKNSEMPDNLCVITFDDGWKEIIDYAYPVLKQYGFTATIFLSPNYIDGKEWFWEERLKYLLAEIFRIWMNSSFGNNLGIQKMLTEYELNNFLSLRSKDLNSYLMDFIITAREKTETWRNSLIMELEKSVARYGGSQARLFLNWDEVKGMTKDGISFGAHTLSHCNLAMCSEAKARHEIVESKKIIEKRLGSPVKAFAYPYGKYNENVRSIVRESGFECACSIDGGMIEKDSDCFVFKRINIHNDVSFNWTMFACRITKLYNIF